MKTKNVAPFDVHFETLDDRDQASLVAQLGRLADYAEATRAVVDLKSQFGYIVINPGEPWYVALSRYNEARSFFLMEVQGAQGCTRKAIWFYHGGRASPSLLETISKFVSRRLHTISAVWRFVLHERLP